MEAITGAKVLHFKDTQQMLLSENIILAYRARKNSQNWGKWAEEFPELERLLVDIEKNLEEI